MVRVAVLITVVVSQMVALEVVEEVVFLIWIIYYNTGKLALEYLAALG